jgi:hypothetical protein
MASHRATLVCGAFQKFTEISTWGGPEDIVTHVSFDTFPSFIVTLSVATLAIIPWMPVIRVSVLRYILPSSATLNLFVP